MTSPGRNIWQIVRYAPAGRFNGIKRPYDASYVTSLRGRNNLEYTQANVTANKLWRLLQERSFVTSFRCQTVQEANEAIGLGVSPVYVSGNGRTRFNLPVFQNQMEFISNQEFGQNPGQLTWGANDSTPVISPVDGSGDTYEMVKSAVASGIAGIELTDAFSTCRDGTNDMLAIVPAGQLVRELNDARLAADVLDVPTLVLGRIKAASATHVLNDDDDSDEPFIDRGAGLSAERFLPLKHGAGIYHAIARSLKVAPFCDVISLDFNSLAEADIFAEEFSKVYPYKLLACNLSPFLSTASSAKQFAAVQRNLSAMGFKLHFTTALQRATAETAELATTGGTSKLEIEEVVKSELP